ncbi:hypothetical protein fugu_002778 [Takifugu bimaculatus]|uniref:Uncharacterized protein n=1 Tax=Takifugu bimaculatus TaxID=433685 RepID=A0A4Z2BES2_9TELE|nr:hypothetical protein fugu_002778 [Takifugu bimaculatus]
MSVAVAESCFLSALQPATSWTAYMVPSDGPSPDPGAKARRVQEQVRMRLAERKSSSLPRLDDSLVGPADYSFPDTRVLGHSLGFSSRSMIHTPSRPIAVSTAPPPLLWLLFSLGGGNVFQGETETKQRCPEQLPFRSGAQQIQTLQVAVSGRPGASPCPRASSHRKSLLPTHVASWYPETQPQWHLGPGQRLLAGGGVAMPTHLQRPLPPHHQPYNQQAAAAAALPAAGFRLCPRGLGWNRPSPPPRW